MGKVFNAAKNKYQQHFQASDKAINQQVRLFGRMGQALLPARAPGPDPFVAIESVLPWEEFTASVGDAQQLAQPGDLWVLGSRQFKDFEEYLVLAEPFAALLQAGELPLAVEPNGEGYLSVLGSGTLNSRIGNNLIIQN